MKSGRKINREQEIDVNGGGFLKMKETWGKNTFKYVFLLSRGSFMNTRSPLAKPESRELRLLISDAVLVYSLEANCRLSFHKM